MYMHVYYIRILIWTYFYWIRLGYRQSLYGIPYACIRRSRYGNIVNNKNTLKHPDVVILDKDNNLIIFCVQYDYILQDVMVRHANFNNSSMFQANKLSISANSNKPKCDDQRSQVYTENKQTEEDKVWYLHFGLSDIWRLLFWPLSGKHIFGQPLRTKSNTVVLNRFW